MAISLGATTTMVVVRGGKRDWLHAHNTSSTYVGISRALWVKASRYGAAKSGSQHYAAIAGLVSACDSLR